MSDSMMKLQVLLRAELAITQIKARRAARRTVMLIVSLVFGLAALAMLNLAGYQHFAATHGAAQGALIMAVLNAAVAAVVIFAAMRSHTGEEEEKLAREMRDLATAELEKDIAQVKAEVRQISKDINSIRTGMSSLASAIATGIGPLLAMAAGLLNRRSERDTAKDDASPTASADPSS